MNATTRARTAYAPSGGAPCRSPRQVEYDAFAKVSAALNAAADGGAGSAAMIRAVHDNRALWITLAAAAADDANALPAETRAGIIGLAAYADRSAQRVLADGASPEALITLNRTIMAGLSPGGAS